MKSFEAIAQNAYQAFRAALPSGETKLSAWNELSPESRAAWMVASRKMAEEIQQVL